LVATLSPATSTPNTRRSLGSASTQRPAARGTRRCAASRARALSDVQARNECANEVYAPDETEGGLANADLSSRLSPLCGRTRSQAEPAILDREATLDRLEKFAAEAADNGAELVAFPETFVSVYPSSRWASAFARWDEADAKETSARDRA
jgi:hypothetical protein